MRAKILAIFASLALVLGLLPAVPQEAAAEESSDLFAGLTPGVDYVEGELVVSYKSGANSEIALLSDDVVEVVDNTAVLSFDSDEEANEVAAELLAGDAVEFVEPNYLFELLDSDMELQGTTVLNDDATKLKAQWALSDSNANMYEFWDSYRANGEFTVAIIDSGIDSDHPDLVNNIVAPTTVVDDGQGYEDVAPNSHGTHVAGIIAAQSNNGLGISGMSYNAKIMPIRAFSSSGASISGTETDIAKAVQYAIDNAKANNVRVINMSIGLTSAGKTSEIVKNAIDAAWDAGILCVCASGNDSSAGNVQDAVFPASYEKTLCVGAMTASHNRLSTSNGGSTLQVVAPGARIYSTTKSSYGYLEGTSMATPYAATIAAMCFMQNDALAPQDVIDVLTSTATDLGTSGWDKETGWGQVNPFAAVTACAEGQTLYRFYNPWDGDHVYTASLAEADGLTIAGWKAESVAWISPFTSETPVYRLYNPYSGDHHYTTSASEYASLKTIGWTQEGTAWYSAENTGTKVYRLFNPYVSKGTHHYTTSYDEYVSIQKVGWRGESIAWYGLAV